MKINVKLKASYHINIDYRECLPLSVCKKVVNSIFILSVNNSAWVADGRRMHQGLVNRQLLPNPTDGDWEDEVESQWIHLFMFHSNKQIQPHSSCTFTLWLYHHPIRVSLYPAKCLRTRKTQSRDQMEEEEICRRSRSFPASLSFFSHNNNDKDDVFVYYVASEYHLGNWRKSQQVHALNGMTITKIGYFAYANGFLHFPSQSMLWMDKVE